jgi:hypothetical protein
LDNPITSQTLRPRKTIIHNCTNTRILAKKFRHMHHLIKDTEEIKIHPSSTNLKDAFSKSRLWKCVIHSLKERKQKAFTKNRIVSLTSATPTKPRGNTTLTCILINISNNLL